MNCIPHITLRTVVDFAKCSLKTTAPTKGHTIRDRTWVYAEPQDEGPGKTASVFDLKLHDPKSYAYLMGETGRVTRVLREDGDHRAAIELAAPIELTMLEISQDAYFENATVYQLAEILTGRFRAWTRAPIHAWYFYRRKGEGRIYLDTILTRREIVRLFAANWTLTDCNDKSAVNRARLYVKWTDGMNALQPHEWRARLEVTLQGDALPCTLESLQCFAFTKLAPMFSYRKLAPDLYPAAHQAMSVWSGDQFGRCGQYRRPSAIYGKYRNTNKSRCGTVADDAANEASYQAFRALTTQWKGRKA